MKLINVVNTYAASKKPLSEIYLYICLITTDLPTYVIFTKPQVITLPVPICGWGNQEKELECLAQSHTAGRQQGGISILSL